MKRHLRNSWKVVCPLLIALWTGSGRADEYQRTIAPPAGQVHRVEGTDVLMFQGRNLLDQKATDDKGVFSFIRLNPHPFELLVVPHYPFLPIRVLSLTGAETKPIVLKYQLTHRYFGSAEVGIGYLKHLEEYFQSIREAIPDTPQMSRIRTRLDELEQKHRTPLRELSLLIPAYFYPDVSTGKWQRVFQIVRSVGASNAVVIVNINSGSPVLDENYTALIDLLNQQGIRWVGYLRLKNNAGVVGDFDQWMNLYGASMGGLFLSDFPNDYETNTDYQKLVAALCERARTRFAHLSRKPLMIADPGTPHFDSLGARQMFDCICVTNAAWSDASHTRPRWWTPQDPRQFGSFVHQMQISHLSDALNDLISQGGSAICFTDARDNSWGNLPSDAFLKELIPMITRWNAHVRRQNQKLR